LASERRDDDVEQRAHPGPGQRGHPRVDAAGLASDATRPTDVRLGRPADQILSDWHANHLVGRHRQHLDRHPRVWGVRVSHAEAVRRHGAKCVYIFPSVRGISDLAIMHTGEWEHFMYVGKVTFFGWALHFCKHFVCPYCTR
jgi:hypothetical protein